MGTENPNPYRYFVTFESEIGCGKTEVHLRLPIRGLDDVKVVERLLSEQGVRGASVTNWVPFDC